MDFLQLAEYGAIIVALGAIGFIVREFLKFVKKQEDNFTEVIKNHLHGDTDAKNKLEQSHARLAMMIENLIKWLDKNNKK